MENPQRTLWKDTKHKSWTWKERRNARNPSETCTGYLPELFKRLYEKIPRSMDEMYRVTTSFLQGEVLRSVKSGKTHPRMESTRRQKQAKFQRKSENSKAPPPYGNSSEKKDSKQVTVNSTPMTGHSTGLKQQLRKMTSKAQKKGKVDGRKRQAPSHLDDSTIGEGEEYGMEGPMIIEAKIRGYFAPAKNKKPNDSSYHITYRIQWRNYLADRLDIPTSKDRQNGYKKDQCRTIHGTWNVKIPSQRRNSDVLEEEIKVAIHPEYPEQTIAIGSTLTKKGRKELCALLRQNLDVFAWKPADMTGVPVAIAFTT
ncbi:hypothetical protein Tco_1427659 [Tanacetum coccineum]